ncbi:hypothetical protein [Novosphingobium cyanobacteriorum]|uniref:Uncharacterized protein n=1 Tax=Novosphingobium cyanobacteriorum TaxID=3024215 RepID=A0ABT6CM48_9SPHN|nr:hypothetical protein [Novosphingobium cyanobacteriorum]MDF8334140.1 hypothetical protein [Novosphingobium cyanobacteriorum]
MVEMIMARQALAELVTPGGTLREAASFLCEQCYELRLHGWAFINADHLTLVPHHLWPILMWVALPDETGAVHFQNEHSTIVGNWPDGRLSYVGNSGKAGAERLDIQGLRFDREELASLKDMARKWHSEVLDASVSCPPADGSAKVTPVLSEAALKSWWRKLPDQLKVQDVDRVLWPLCRKDHPDHLVARSRVRKLAPNRKTGPRSKP